MRSFIMARFWATFACLIVAILALAALPSHATIIIDSFSQATPAMTTGTNDDAGGILLSRRAGVLGGVISLGADASEVLKALDTVGGMAAEIFWPSPNDSVPDTDYTGAGAEDHFELDVSGVIGIWSAALTADDGVNSATVSVDGISGPGVVSFAFADFTGVDLASVDSLRLLLTDATEIGDTLEALEFRAGTVTAVPEPSALAMMGLGLAGLGFLSRRRALTAR